ncbi:MAG: AAA family ATPase [Dysgonamonadaceae bacterium]|jgi:predicted AAA+ superfamily ATPase|nr:AAA family ATPase [Dysgonamonadaceae bacterium]
MFERILKLEEIADDSLFLWGARQTGKSTLLEKLFPNAVYYDLLKNNEFERLQRNPSLLREELEKKASNTIVIIDEIQKIPQLLDEVHWLFTRKNLKFILCGSSARKMMRVGANLLGGRALRTQLYPLVSAEIPDFNLNRAINNGMLPRHYTVSNAERRLQAYIGEYLNEEIRAEAITRNLHTFTRFMEIAAQSDGEMLVYKNIAQDCGVTSPTVKEYFNILQQTLIGYLIDGFTGTKKRQGITAPKFYYFDVGIANYLMKRENLVQGTDDYGHAFEHLVIQEIIAYLGYANSKEKLTYWRSTSGYEVDCIIGDGRVAIEIKSCEEIKSRHTKGLKAFAEDFPNAKLLVVSHDCRFRTMNGVDIYPVLEFLQALWNRKII